MTTSAPATSSLFERTVPGLHDALLEFLMPRIVADAAILDCGAGSGAWVERLRRAGFTALYGIDRCGDEYAGSAPFAEIELNSDFAGPAQAEFGRASFDLITAIEVLEHLENPSHFLRQCRLLLNPAGRILISSPNSECAPARLRFLFRGSMRHFDEHGDPTHITPVFPSLLARIAVPAGFRVDGVWPAPSPWGFAGTGPWKRVICRAFARFASGRVSGDCNLFLLSRLD